jgi:hypothetical protein
LPKLRFYPTFLDALYLVYRRNLMHRTIEVIVEAGGRVRLLEDIQVQTPRRALLTILDEPAEETNTTALLSEPALAEDWRRPEEEEAWSHLQREA